MTLLMRMPMSKRVKAPAVAAGSVLQSSDFTYLGAFKVPRVPITGSESIYGDGLTLRVESSDTGNEVHLLSAAYNATPNHAVYEFRETTPSLGSPDPTDPDNYTTATVVKQYGDIYSSKKKIIYDGDETQLTNQLDGGYGLHWDDVDDRLYWCYGFGYSTGNPADALSWCFGYSTLNYGAGTGAGFGPWLVSGQAWKAMMGAILAVPSSYASTYLSGKRLALGVGGYYSIVSADDCSMGPSLTAINAITSESEEDAVPGTALVGYWPFSGAPTGSNGRGNRPADRLYNATADYNVDADWPASKMSWTDRVRGGCWIDTGTKKGVLFVGNYGKDYTQYLSSQIYSSKHGHHWAIYDPADFTPASGTARYNIQPDSIYEVEYPTVDYTQAIYAGGASKAITSITSTNGTPQNATGNTVVTAASHGWSNDQVIEIRGTSQAIYNGMWQITVLDSNTFGIRNTSLSSNWNGASATGGTAYNPVTGGADRTLGACYNPATGKLYIAVSVEKGINGSNSYVFIHVYQVSQD